MWFVPDVQILNFKDKNYSVTFIKINRVWGFLRRPLEIKNNPEIAKQYQGGVHLVIRFI